MTSADDGEFFFASKLKNLLHCARYLSPNSIFIFPVLPLLVVRSFASADDALKEYRKYLPPSTDVLKKGLFNGRMHSFRSGPRSDEWDDFFGTIDGVPSCMHCEEKFNGGKSFAQREQSAMRHIKQFHAKSLYMCPLPCWSHPVPVISHCEESMRRHLQQDHRKWSRDKETFFIDLHAAFNLQPLRFNYDSLNIPFIPLARQSGFVSLAQRELTSPFRTIAAGYFNVIPETDTQHDEMRNDPITRWLWTGDLPNQDRLNVLRAKPFPFDEPLRGTNRIWTPLVLRSKILVSE